MDPDELTSSSSGSDEDEDPINQLEFEDPGDYDPKEPVRIFARGYADSYDEWILVVLDVEPNSDEPDLRNLEALSASSPDRFTDLVYDGSRDFDQGILNLRNSLDQSELKDSTNFENKMEGLLAQTSTLDNVVSPLFEENLEEFRQGFTDFLIGEVFPGSQLDLHVRAISLEDREEEQETAPSQDSTEQVTREIEKQEEDEGEDEDSLQLLRVSPELDPLDGFALSDLRVGDFFDVRVVGASVRDLRNRYVKGNPQEAKQSKIFNAQLVRIQDISLEGVKKYIVQLDQNIYGECILDPATRVKVRSVGDVSFPARFKYRFFPLCS
jgi:hypothetical protein